MLIEFKLKNWKCFKEENIFAMYANNKIGRGSQAFKKKHLLNLKINSENLNILPFSAIYGPNNSGKTAFFEAISFCKDLLLSSDSRNVLSRLTPYYFSEKTESTLFNFSVFYNQTIYEYEFELSKNIVLREALTKISNDVDMLIFKRNTNNSNDNQGNILDNDKEMKTHIATCPKHKLFVSHFSELNISKKCGHIESIKNWFLEKLTLIGANQHYIDFEIMNDIKLEKFNKIIKGLDLGMEKLKLEPSSETDLKDDFPSDKVEHVLNNVKAKYKEGTGGILFNLAKRSIYYVMKRSNKPIIKKLTSLYKNDAGEETNMPLINESDGTWRIFGLIQLLIKLHSENYSTLLVDEIDRSLHTALTRELIKIHIKAILNEGLFTQLIVTTHDLHLLDLTFLRKDEFWLVDKKDKTSLLSSFNDYTLRSDKKLRKHYMEGRLGGIPETK